MKQTRDANTDLVRALAITLVLIHHLGQNLLSFPVVAYHYFNLGFHGVTLFFVLSGWLIGGLYWRERERTGRVNIWRFWGRRWLRTLPPYFAVLPLAFIAVWWFRDEPFNWRYLFFLQNYLTEMPFFLVSWSLAVEEHFYLILPLALGLIGWLRSSMHVALLALIALSVSARFIDPSAQLSDSFGYGITASHLNMSGLMMGVYLAYVYVHLPSLWQQLEKLAKRSLLPLAIVFLTVPFWPAEIRHNFGSVFVSLLCAVGLMVCLTCKTFSIAKRTLTKKLALWSYSIYLTHALVINASLIVTAKLGIHTNVMLILATLLIVLVGAICYALVEKPSMTLRERLLPKG